MIALCCISCTHNVTVSRHDDACVLCQKVTNRHHRQPLGGSRKLNIAGSRYTHDLEPDLRLVLNNNASFVALYFIQRSAAKQTRKTQPEGLRIAITQHN